MTLKILVMSFASLILQRALTWYSSKWGD